MFDETYEEKGGTEKSSASWPPIRLKLDNSNKKCFISTIQMIRGMHNKNKKMQMELYKQTVQLEL